MTALVQERPIDHHEALPDAPAATSIPALLLAGGGGLHLAAALSHRPAAVAVTVFALAAVVQLGLAVTLVLRPTRGVRVVALLGTLLFVLAWVASRTVGLSIGHAAGAHHGIGALDGATVLVEIATVVAIVAGRWRSNRLQMGSRWAVMAVSVFALGAGAALSEVGGSGGGGHDHADVPARVARPVTAGAEPSAPGAPSVAVAEPAAAAVPADVGATPDHSDAEPHGHP